MTGKDHNKLLAILHLVQGSLQALGGIIVGLVFGIIGVSVRSQAEFAEEKLGGTIVLGSRVAKHFI